MTQERISDPLFLRLRHALAEVQLVLFGLLVWASDHLGDWWRDRAWRIDMLDDLRALRRAQAMLVFLAAQARLDRAPPGAPGGAPCTTAQDETPGAPGGARSGPTARAHRPPNAPSGFSRALYTHRRRTIWRLVSAGRGLRGRIEALRDARDSLDKLVTRMVARLREGARVAAYIMTRAPIESCTACALVAPACVDSS